MAGNVNYDKTILLLDMDGDNDSTVFVDRSYPKKSITAYGGAKLSTAQKKFGVSSATFSGGASYLAAETGSYLSVGTGDFAIRAWAYLTSTVNYPYIFHLSHSSVKALVIRYGDYGLGYKLNVSIQGDTLAANWSCSLTDAGSLNAWNYIEFNRSSGVCRLFVNGITQSINSGANPSSYPYTSFTDSFNVVSAGSALIGYQFIGYIDSLDVLTIAEHTADYTPPTAPPLPYAAQIAYTLTESLLATQFRMVSSKISDGSWLSAEVITGSGTLGILTLDAIVLTCTPMCGNKWTAGTIYAAGDLVFSAVSPAYYFKRVAGTGGTSGSVEPTWINTVGDTATDDGIWSNCWECIAILTDSISHSPVVPSISTLPTVEFNFNSAGGGGALASYLHRAWSPDNAAFVFWVDTAINLSPTVTSPASVIDNLVNKCVVM